MHRHFSSWRCGIIMVVLLVCLLPTGCIGWSSLHNNILPPIQQQLSQNSSKNVLASVFLATSLLWHSPPPAAAAAAWALEPMSSQQAAPAMHVVVQQQQPSSSVALLAADSDENKWSSDSLFPNSKTTTTITPKEGMDNVPSTTSRRRNIQLPRSALDPSKMNPQRVTGLVYLTQDKEDSQILQQQMMANEQEQEEEETTTNYQITLTVATMDNDRILAGVKVPLSAIGSFPFRFDLGIEHIKSGVSVQDFQTALNQNDLLVQAAICPAGNGGICTPPNSVWAGEGISKYLPDISGLMMDDDNTKNNNGPREKIALRAGASVPLERNKDLLLLSKEK